MWESINEIILEIPGKPMGKQRPRLCSFGVYTPKETQQYEKLIKKTFKDNYDEDPTEDYLSVEIEAYFLPPKSLTKRKKAKLYGQPYTNKPDADNIAKIVLDGLNGVAFVDDKQVVDLKVTKRYLLEGEEEEGIRITINKPIDFKGDIL